MSRKAAMERYYATHRRYSRGEIAADGVVHAAGLGLSIVGSELLLNFGMGARSDTEIAGLAVYLVSLFVLMASSAAYNLTKPSELNWLLRSIDHSAIYLLIAGTYTPMLVQLPDRATAVTLGFVIWTAALLGMALKVFFPGKYDRPAIVIYLLLGWVGAFQFRQFIEVLPPLTFNLILIGGVIYSAGVVFHIWRALRFHNAIWHTFVLAGVACHFAAVWILYAR